MSPFAFQVWLFLAWLPLQADDDSFRERFADPATRDAALAELVPDTREAWFHTALAHQLAGREDAFAQTLEAWKAAPQRKDHPVSATGIEVLENRALLIDYQNNPDRALAALIHKLDLRNSIKSRTLTKAKCAGSSTICHGSICPEWSRWWREFSNSTAASHSPNTRF